MADTMGPRATPIRLVVASLLLAVPTGCGDGQVDGASTSTTGGTTATSTTTPSSTTTPTRNTQALASAFPAVEDFVLVEMDDDEWAKTFKVVNEDFKGQLSGGAGRHGFTRDQEQVFDISVLTPKKDHASPELMKAEMARLYALAEKNNLDPRFTRIAGHDMLEFTDAAENVNWYWISGKEYVCVAALDRESGLKFLRQMAPLVF